MGGRGLAAGRPAGSRPPTVVFISHSSGMGGGERALLEAVDALTPGGVPCRVVLPRRGWLSRELRARGIPCAVVPFTWWMGGSASPLARVAKALVNLGTLLPLALRILRWNGDVVYTNSVTVPSGALAAKLLRRPHVWHIHEFGAEDHGLRFDWGERFSLRLVGRLSSACVVASPALGEKYRAHIAPSKLKTLFQAVTLPGTETADAPPPGDSFRCVLVGALHEGKGQAEAIRALGCLARDGLAVELEIVGGGGSAEYRRKLEALAESCGVRLRVVFAGPVENVSSKMRGAGAILVCSRSEAFGRVTVEGMLAHRPVVGARSGATAELIRDGETGLLYTPGDHRELAEKIRLLYDHPEQAEEMAGAGHAWAAGRFTMARYGRELRALLEAVHGSSEPTTHTLPE